jgi:hypothetical protein
MTFFLKWGKCLENFPDKMYEEMREFDPDYDEGKLAMSKTIHTLNLRIKTLLLENDTLKDIMERKKHLLRSPSQHRSKAES